MTDQFVIEDSRRLFVGKEGPRVDLDGLYVG